MFWETIEKKEAIAIPKAPRPLNKKEINRKDKSERRFAIKNSLFPLRAATVAPLAPNTALK